VLFTLYHLHVPWVMPATLVEGIFLEAYPTRRFQSAWMGIIVHSVQSVFVIVVVMPSCSSSGVLLFRDWVNVDAELLIFVPRAAPSHDSACHHCQSLGHLSAQQRVRMNGIGPALAKLAWIGSSNPRSY
jgi:hypothetical protein